MEGRESARRRYEQEFKNISLHPSVFSFIRESRLSSLVRTVSEHTACVLPRVSLYLHRGDTGSFVHLRAFPTPRPCRAMAGERGGVGLSHQKVFFCSRVSLVGWLDDRHFAPAPLAWQGLKILDERWRNAFSWLEGREAGLGWVGLGYFLQEIPTIQEVLWGGSARAHCFSRLWGRQGLLSISFLFAFRQASFLQIVYART